MKRLFFMMLAGIMCIFLLGACGDDSSEKSKKSVAEILIGKWKETENIRSGSLRKVNGYEYTFTEDGEFKCNNENGLQKATYELRDGVIYVHNPNLKFAHQENYSFKIIKIEEDRMEVQKSTRDFRETWERIE